MPPRREVISLRRTDSEDSEEYKNRRVVISAEGPAVVVDGWIGRATALARIANQVTATTVLLGIVVFIGLVWIGKIDVPIYGKLDSLIAADLSTLVRLGSIEVGMKNSHDELTSIRATLVTFWRVECENAARGEAALRNCQNIK